MSDNREHLYEQRRAFEELRGNEQFPPGTPREEQRRWWLARLELLEREQRHAEAEYAKLIHAS